MKGIPRDSSSPLMDDAGLTGCSSPPRIAETTFNMVTPNETVHRIRNEQARTFYVYGRRLNPHKGMKAVRLVEHLAKTMNMKCLCLSHGCIR